MLSSAEIARGSRGAVKFLSRDVSAPLHFDNTPEACLRSFQVMVLVAPVYAVYLVVHYMQVNTTADEGQIALAEGLRYVVDWLLYPVIFYEIARRRGWLERYPRYIASLNWINLPAVILLLISELVAALVPPGAAALLQIALQALFFYWFLVITRLALGTDWAVSVVLLAVNWIPSFFLLIIVDRYIGVLAGP